MACRTGWVGPESDGMEPGRTGLRCAAVQDKCPATAHRFAAEQGAFRDARFIPKLEHSPLGKQVLRKMGNVWSAGRSGLMLVQRFSNNSKYGSLSLKQRRTSPVKKATHSIARRVQ